MVEAKGHIVLCKRAAKSPLMHVSYNDIRFVPRGELLRELLQEEITENTPEDEENENASGNKVNLTNV